MYQVTAELVGSPSTLFSWKKDRCEPEDTPDSQPRAFRDSAGMLHLFSISDKPHALIGPSMGNLRRDCQRALAVEQSKDPSSFVNHSWLSSFFTSDGHTVYALVHNEFRGWEQSSNICPSHSVRKCFYASITSAKSLDGGDHFIHNSQGLVASLPYRYIPDMGYVGYVGLSNILNVNGFYYAAFTALKYRAQLGGVCMMRTRTIEDPSSWRAWDGHDFSISFADPYSNPGVDPSKHVCAPVSPALAGLQAISLVRHEPDGLFVMIGLKPTKLPDHQQKPFVAPYASTSTNLIDWSPVMPVLSPEDEERLGPTWYPTFIDPDAPGRNFSTIGDTPDLLYVHYASKVDPRPRELLRVPLDLRLVPH
jgi:hypothetical protein